MDMRMTKRRRVHSFEPNALSVHTDFARKYFSYLLPALLKLASSSTSSPYIRNKDEDIEKKVRFEVQMALVLSSGEFQWCRALKCELEQGTSTKNLMIGDFVSKSNLHDRIRACPKIPRPMFHGETMIRPKRVAGKRSSKKKVRGAETGFGYRLRTLSRILPGGTEMGVCELLSEVESYVVCLQLQVNLLRSLVAAH